MMQERVGLISIGFWRQKPRPGESGASLASLFSGFLDSFCPWPGDFVDHSWDSAERAIIVEYLEREAFRGPAYMGYSECRLCDKQDNGDADYTDGVYKWPEGYAHYLDEHGVKPPKEFIEHVLAVRNQPSPARASKNDYKAVLDAAALLVKLMARK